MTYGFSLQSASEAHPEADDTCHLKFTLPFGHWPLLPSGPDPTCPWEIHILCLSAALSWILVPEKRCVGRGRQGGRGPSLESLPSGLAQSLPL